MLPLNTSELSTRSLLAHFKLPAALLLVILCLTCLSYPAISNAAQKVDVWCYYNDPPFTIEPKHGLKFDLVKLMNEEAKGKFFFELLSMSRKRLDTFLSHGIPGAVLFVSPDWMKERGDAKFVWSKPILHGRNEIVSRRKDPIRYSKPKSLYGLTLAGVFGHKYKNLDEAIAQGKITRIDSASMDQNLRTVIENRGKDFTPIASSVLGYLLHKYGYENKAYISPTPLHTYARYILLNNPSPDLVEFIAEFTSGLSKNKKWQKIKTKYKIYYN
ncbi:MAG TPA: hypothetical protein DCS48_03080 [Desulfovibrio sp.]|nr:hypothetical protein [Desulfovibrio sp.]